MKLKIFKIIFTCSTK